MKSHLAGEELLDAYVYKLVIVRERGSGSASNLGPLQSDMRALTVIMSKNYDSEGFDSEIEQKHKAQ